MKKRYFLGAVSFFLLLLTANGAKAQADDNPQAAATNTSEYSDSSQQDQGSDQNNQQTEGWQKVAGHNVYLKDNQRLTGLKKIQDSWYLFDKNGYTVSGLHRLPHKKSYAYFDEAGKKRIKNTKTKKAYYWINKKGEVTGIRNYAKVVCQRPQMPTGCEITAVTMMLNFAGKKVSKFKAAKLMHRSKNPNKGFIGSPYKKYPGGYWVAPKGVRSVVKHYLHKAKIMTRCSLKAIKAKLLQSHLVVAWVGWWDHFSNHAIALTGYHGSRLYYNDPWTGTKRSMSVKTFMRHWRLDAYRALSY